MWGLQDDPVKDSNTPQQARPECAIMKGWCNPFIRASHCCITLLHRGYHGAVIVLSSTFLCALFAPLSERLEDIYKLVVL